MLFHTYLFIFGFLPATLIAFFVAAKINRKLPVFVLIAASLVFYAYWMPAVTLLLVGSIVFNYLAGLYLQSDRPKAQRRIAVIVAVAIDLALLGFFKYANFFLGTVEALGGFEKLTINVILPIGISFYTFTQIAYLVDSYKGEVKEKSFSSYVLFVTFFPHLIAGPVLHHKEMMPQFADPNTYRFNWLKITLGALLFAIGLWKKVVFADTMAPWANEAFGAVAKGASPEGWTAWGGALAYTFQIYFDFSGYSDMAVGIALMFGVKLPINFDSPYRSTSIVEFWRRWHMTLSRFLRDYLYIPLGGNRNGDFDRYRNLFLTMLLGGLWHGASWLFVVWGALHGLYLIVAHLSGQAGLKLSKLFGKTAAPFVGWGLTMLAVIVAWVFFRAPTIETATSMLAGMGGANGFDAQVLASFLADPRLWGVGSPIIVALVAVAAPNSMWIIGRAEQMLKDNRRIATIGAGALAGVASLVALIFIGAQNEFLYFQF
ncbi:MAG TPA: MBOAT family protein [Hyphomonadaceae bacterium]|jgi:D-alanyl-lipoteichoic acid acyltransferase DltB (MBOAT superfamily)|nr:MBOAT family protein [Hyphomonadaceae bacterium]